MRFTRLAIISAALTVFAGTAQAQNQCTSITTSKSDFNALSCNATSSVDITVPYLASAQASSITGFTVTVDDLNLGYKLFPGANVTVKTNFKYKVTATAAANGVNTKATTNLLIKTGAADATGDNYTAMGAGVEIGSGEAGTAGVLINTFHRLNVTWTTDAPGAQKYDLTYTVTAP
jgi:hypothetical protein